MRIVLIFHIACLSTLFSCSTKLIGLYVGEMDSGVKYIAESRLLIGEKRTFILTINSTSLDAIPPNGLIYELLGEYDCDDDKVTLTPTKERRSIVHYDLSDKPTSSLGARGNAYIAQDTLVGEMQTIGTNKPIKLNLVKRPNLYYLWNEQYCYVRSHLKKDTINLLSYCNQIMLRN